MVIFLIIFLLIWPPKPVQQQNPSLLSPRGVPPIISQDGGTPVDYCVPSTLVRTRFPLVELMWEFPPLSQKPSHMCR
jgi:hypothetical protein